MGVAPCQFDLAGEPWVAVCTQVRRCHWAMIGPWDGRRTPVMVVSGQTAPDRSQVGR
jgi:hypothetical protein